MNSFGRLFRTTILGESHGTCVGIVIDGCPAGLPLAPEDFAADLDRRRGGTTYTTPRAEKDLPLIESGLFDGHTTGAPLSIFFHNHDIRSQEYFALRNLPRPGHADLTTFQKSGGYRDFRGGGHSSGRLTLGMVAAGVVAKKLLSSVEIKARIVEIGGEAEETKWKKLLAAAKKKGDSLGGLIRVSAYGLPAGVGEPFFDSVESVAAHLLFSIPGIKGVEFGAGFAAARMKGSEMNDPIVSRTGRTETNNAGGINGGITNGNEFTCTLAVRPTPSISLPQTTVDLESGKKTEITIAGRHDTCFALRLPPIVEGAVATLFADLMLIGGQLPRVYHDRDA